VRRPDGLHVLGIRHHGPGSARAVRAALDELQPACVLVEGPPDADGALVHLADLVPPVALMVHSASDASSGGFWPFADFSPEWQALLWAAERGVPSGFCDLPHSADTGEGRARTGVRADPLGWLAEAAGHDDPERWWEDVVEHRQTGDATTAVELFTAVTEVMTALREESPETDPHDLRREAAMRQVVRAALKHHETVAVVCGAWHAPALVALGPATADAALLKGLPRAKTSATWVPWTSQRLAAASGYGAGVRSPGWYAHLWRHTDEPVARWFARTCAVLRQHDLPASPASSVEAVRLADALASLRGRGLPGLTELTDATLTVLCHGDRAPLDVIARELLVGSDLGSVPPSVPTVPLQGDLDRLQRRLRMPATPAAKVYDLDLRGDTDLARSHLLHRLALLGVEWGTAQDSRGTGTFRETWHVAWQPELALAVIDASRYGRTVELAAVAQAVETAGGLTDLAAATVLTERVLLAELPDALPEITSALDRCAAATSDVLALLRGVPPLVRSLRYGTVRGTPATSLQVVLDSLVDRACVNLVLGVAGLDDDGARDALPVLEQAHDAVALLADPVHTASWQAALAALGESAVAPGLLAGRATRLLLDGGLVEPELAATRLSLTLSGPRERAVSWLEGFVQGSAVLLLRDEVLFGLLDAWVAELPADDFDEVLPLLRRAFSAFTRPERRQIGARAASGVASSAPRAAGDPGLDLVAGAAVLARVRSVLGHP
jgi:hypothetical protein